MCWWCSFLQTIISIGPTLCLGTKPTRSGSGKHHVVASNRSVGRHKHSWSMSEVTTGFVAANIIGNVPDFLSKYPCFVPRSRTGNCPRPPLKHRWWKWLEKGWNKVLSALTGFLKHGEVPSLLYKYIMAFCALVPLFIFFAPAPHMSCVRPWKCHSSSTCTNVNVTAICRNRQHLLSRLGCDFMGCVVTISKLDYHQSSDLNILIASID